MVKLILQSAFVVMFVSMLSLPMLVISVLEMTRGGTLVAVLAVSAWLGIAYVGHLRVRWVRQRMAKLAAGEVERISRNRWWVPARGAMTASATLAIAPMLRGVAGISPVCGLFLAIVAGAATSNFVAQWSVRRALTPTPGTRKRGMQFFPPRGRDPLARNMCPNDLRGQGATHDLILTLL